MGGLDWKHSSIGLENELLVNVLYQIHKIGLKNVWRSAKFLIVGGLKHRMGIPCTLGS